MTLLQLQLKAILLLAIYTYAFYLDLGDASVWFLFAVIGCTPFHVDETVSTEECLRYAISTAKIIDNAGYSYNYGLRSFYFSLSILPWLSNTWLFMAAATLVVAIFYCHEFYSGTLKTLVKKSN